MSTIRAPGRLTWCDWNGCVAIRCATRETAEETHGCEEVAAIVPYGVPLSHEQPDGTSVPVEPARQLTAVQLPE